MDYFVIVDKGHKVGPVPKDTLEMWAKEGRLLPDAVLPQLEPERHYRAIEVLDWFRSNQAFAAYPRPDAVLPEEDGSKEMVWVWVSCIMSLVGGIFCCFLAIASGSAGIVSARRAQRKGHPGAVAGIYASTFCMLVGFSFQIAYLWFFGID